MSKRIGSVLMAFLGGVAISLGQGTVTFDHSVLNGPGIVWGNSSYTESSMVFQPGPGSVALWMVGPYYAGTPDDGSTYLQMGYGDSLVFSDLAHRPFSVTSIDLAEFSTGPASASTISFLGYHSDGSIVSATFTTDGIADGIGGAADFQTFLFGAGWSDLTRVEVPGASSPGQGWSMDNLVYGGSSSIFAVPEPGIGALLALGALGYQFRRKQRQRAQ